MTTPQRDALIKVRIIIGSGWYRDYVDHVYHVLPKKACDNYYDMPENDGRVIKDSDCVVVVADEMVIDIENEEHGNEVQQYLFDKGYIWAMYGPTGRKCKKLDHNYYIVTDDCGRIRYGNKQTKGKDTGAIQHYRLAVKKTYALEKLDTIVIDGKVYLAADVLRAINELAVRSL